MSPSPSRALCSPGAARGTLVTLWGRARVGITGQGVAPGPACCSHPISAASGMGSARRALGGRSLTPGLARGGQTPRSMQPVRRDTGK